jgi:threonine dehydrogenase-like Zn-dependent dehydrogenase
MVRRPCQHKSCRACRTGHQDFCFTGDFFERGIKEAHGFLSEYVVESEEYLVAVPPMLRDFAVLTEPLAIAEKALGQVWNIQERLPWNCRHQPGLKSGSCHNAVVLGSGPIGILGAMCLMDAGFQTHVYSRDPEPNPKADIVKSVGAEYISSEKTTVKQLADFVGNIDLVYEATGASKLSFDVLKHMGTNGIFVFTGIPGRKHPIEMDTDLLMRNLVLKNLVVLGTVNAGKEAYEKAVEHLETFHRRWPDDLQRLITGRYPLESFEELVKGRIEGIKNVISFAVSR